jgi:pimeloyl-ACP methyl ester carboxylesterase
MDSEILINFADDMLARTSTGQGEGVLWIHGYTLHSGLWRELWNRLPEWRHIGVDLPGHGYTPPSKLLYSLPSLARLIGNAAISQKIQHLVGLSFGGTLALQIAAEFPAVFKTVILGSAGLTGGPEEPEARTRYFELMTLYRQHGAGPWMTEAWMKSPPNIFASASLHPALFEQLREAIGRHTWSEISTGLMRELTSYHQVDYLDHLTHIEAAMLILVGEREMPAFRQAATLIERQVPNSRIVYLPDSGHLCMLEIPSVVSDLIGDHLRFNFRTGELR